MADTPPPADTENEIDNGPAPASTSGTPRWLKVIGIGVILLVVLVVILLLIGGSLGGHGPRMHN